MLTDEHLHGSSRMPAQPVVSRANPTLSKKDTHAEHCAGGIGAELPLHTGGTGVGGTGTVLAAVCTINAIATIATRMVVASK